MPDTVSAPIIDQNFDAEYKQVRELAGDTLTTVTGTRTTLEDGINRYHHVTMTHLYDHPADLETMQSTVSRASNVLNGCSQFLVSDVYVSQKALRDSLSIYSNLVRSMLKENNFKPEDIPDESRSSEVTGDADLTQLYSDLNELEHLAKEEEKLRLAEEKELQRKLAEEQIKREEEEKARIKFEEEQRIKEEESRIAEEKERQDQERLHELQREEEEEELQRKMKEEWKIKANPANWLFIIYELNEKHDRLGSGIACVVRACPLRVSLRKEQLQCTSVDWQDCEYPLGDHEELVSTMICLRPTDGNEIELEDIIDPPEANYRTVWIALPYALVPRDREAIVRIQLARPSTPSSSSSTADKRTVMKPENDTEAGIVVEPTSEWSDVTTRETTIKGLDNVCFVETPVKRIDSGGINLVVVTRPKRDHAKWGERGGRVVSSVDPLVSVSAPKNAFQDTASISLQMFVIDAAVIYGLKERYNGCDMLLGASPIVCYNASSRPLKPLTFTVPSPSGGGINKKTPWRIGTNASPVTKSISDESEDVIQLVVKDASGRWRHRNNIKLEKLPNCVEFNLSEIFCHGILLLRTPPAANSDELCLMASCLEASLIERPAQLVVRQREDDPSSVYVELCRRDAVDRLINGERLRSLGYTAGPGPSRLVCLREGDLVEMSFRDNIEPIEISEDGKEIPSAEPVRRFIFNSNMASINAQLMVRERSSYIQNVLREYQGYIRLRLIRRPYAPPPRVTGPYGIGAANGSAKKTTASLGASGKASNIDENLVCEVLVTLPKRPKGFITVKRINMEITPNGPLTSEYYDQLSEHLGEEWKSLAEKLGLKQSAIQRIINDHAHLGESSESSWCSAKKALKEWHMSTIKFPVKVEVLIQALNDADREDLAMDLRMRNDDHRKTFNDQFQNKRLKKSVKMFVNSVPAVRAWREIGRDLGLTADELEAIGGPAAEIKRPSPAKPKKASVENLAEVRVYAEKMLNKWIELDGENATTDQLIAALKKRKLTNIAESMMLVK